MTAPADKLLALAERVEALTGSDREVDAEIFAAISIGKWRCVSARKSSKHGAVVRYFDNGRHGVATAPSYTFSVDDALSLVPEGHAFSLHCDADGSVFAGVMPDDGDGCDDARPCGSNPALALCAAALRSMASREGER